MVDNVSMLMLRRCVHRAMQWLATLVFLVCLLGWGASMVWYYGYVTPSDALAGRQLSVKSIPNQIGFGLDLDSSQPAGWFASPTPQIEIKSWGIDNVRIGSARFMFIPFWIPVSALLLVTLWMWSGSRRYGPGRCVRCGHRMDNAPSRRCPECGETA